jgi:predicted ATPase
VAVVSGTGGVGKTTLAVHVAHQLVCDFPDGQLYADLRGADGDPRVVLGRFLRLLGAGRDAISAGLEERAGWFRSLLGVRRVLVVLDDAASDVRDATSLAAARARLDE